MSSGAGNEALDVAAGRANAADDLLAFLAEGQLDHYYGKFMQEGITRVSHLRDVEQEDYSRIGLKPVEVKRLERMYSKWKKENRQSLSVRFKAKVLRRPSAADLKGASKPKDGHSPPPACSDSPVCLIQPQQLTLLRQLGKGSFGIVNEARWAKGDGQAMLVAVKTLDAHTSTDQVQSQLQARFIKEANILHQVSSHRHIIKLLGIVIDPRRLMIVQELAKYGSLLSQLRERPMPLSVLQLCLFARQIASAMKFLEKKSLVHRDLAARNVLLAERQTVKLSDFGLSRVISQHSSVVSQPTAVPVAWTAPEAVTENAFSHKSDVWSFGVTLWEMLSEGARPYATKSMYEIIKCVQPPQNYRLERPPHCPITIYKVMLNCWEEEPAKRPSFERLEELIRVNTPPQGLVIHKQEQCKDRDEIALHMGEMTTVLDTSGERWIAQNSRCEIGFIAPDCVRIIDPPEPDVLDPRPGNDGSNQSSSFLYPNLSSDGDSGDNYVNMSAAKNDGGYAVLRKLDFLPASASSTSSGSRLSVGQSTPLTSGSPSAAASAISSSSVDQADSQCVGSPRSSSAGRVSTHSSSHHSAGSNSSHSQWQPELVLEHQDTQHSQSSSGSHTSQVSADELLHGEPPNPQLLPPPLVGVASSAATNSSSTPAASAAAKSSDATRAISTRKAPRVLPNASTKTPHSGSNSPEVHRATQSVEGASSGKATSSSASARGAAKPQHSARGDEHPSEPVSAPAASVGGPNGSPLAPLEEGSAQVARLKLLLPAKSDEECRRALIASQWSVDAAFRYICVNDLMSLALPLITPHQCLRALEHCNWKVDRAAEWLLQLSLDS